MIINKRGNDVQTLQTDYTVGQKVLYKNTNSLSVQWREGTFLGTTAKRIKVYDGYEQTFAPKNVKPA